MTTDYHSPIPNSPNQEAGASLFNSRFFTLDTGIGDSMSFGLANNHELSLARAPYQSLKARLDDMVGGYVGGNIATLTDGAASSGQKAVTVDSTTNFLVSGRVAYLRADGTLEYNVIASITPTTVLTMTTNIGEGGIANNTYIGMISVPEYQAANAIPHAGELTLPQAVEYINGGAYNTRAYGASAAAPATHNRAAIQVVLDEMMTGGRLVIDELFPIDAPLTIAANDDIEIVGERGGGFYATGAGFAAPGGVADRRYLFAYGPGVGAASSEANAAKKITFRSLRFISDGNSVYGRPEFGVGSIFDDGPGAMHIGYNKLTVVNCFFEGFYREAIMPYGGQDHIIRNNFFYNCNHNCIALNSGASGTLISGNVSRNCGQLVESGAVGGVVITDNIVIGPTWAGFNLGGSEDESDIPSTFGVICANNLVTANYDGDTRWPAYGIVIRPNLTSCLIQGNVIYKPLVGGIYLYNADVTSAHVMGRVAIRDNHIIDVQNPSSDAHGSGIYFALAGNVYRNIDIEHNTIYNSTPGTYKMYYGIEMNQYPGGQIKIHGNRITNAKRAGLFMPVGPIENISISDNDIEAVGSVGIYLNNTSGQGLGVVVANNRISYNIANGDDVPYAFGVGVYASALNWASVTNNYVSGQLASDTAAIGVFLSACHDTFESGNVAPNCRLVPAVYEDSCTGTYNALAQGTRKTAWNGLAPTTGRWSAGSVVWNNLPSVGEDSGWICSLPVQGWGKQGGSSTTGGITTGTAALVVASATGWQVGDAITVAGAGGGGGLLTSWIIAINGTAFTLGSNAATTVSGAAVAHITPTWQAI